MSTEKSRIIISILLLALAACSPLSPPEGEPGGQPTNTAPPGESAEQPTSTAAPSCPDASYFGRISPYWPVLFKIMPASPTFTWFYSTGGPNMTSLDDWEQACVPESYTLHLSSGPDFDDELVFQVQNPTVMPDLTKLTVEWTLDATLDPMKVYRWLVVGHYGDITISDWALIHLHDDGWWPPGSQYFRSVFRTGPECPSGGIAVPTLTYPENGAVIQTLNPVFHWDVAGCMPLVFMVEISTTPTFDNPQSYVDPQQPGDYTKKTQTNYPFLLVEYTLRDCTEYFWHVTPGIGEGGSGGFREWGTTSANGSFRVDLGQCPTPTPTLPPTLTPTLTPTRRPTATPTFTSTPAPLNCSTLDPNQCLQYPQCKWVFIITRPGGGYCTAR